MHSWRRAASILWVLLLLFPAACAPEPAPKSVSHGPALAGVSLEEPAGESGAVPGLADTQVPTPSPAPLNLNSTANKAANPAFPILAGQHEYSFQTSQHGEVRYLMYLPPDFGNGKRWPLILYLHSSLEVGTDLAMLRQSSLPQHVEQTPGFPFIVVSPQIESGYWFEAIDGLEDLLSAMLDALPVDSQRLYLTGFSLGGYGAWAYAYRYPLRFAAIAPVAGSLDLGEDFSVPFDFCKLKSLPVWDFQGEDDSTVDPAEAQELVLALKGCGGEARLSLYPEVGHMQTRDLAYAETGLFDWFLTHHR